MPLDARQFEQLKKLHGEINTTEVAPTITPTTTQEPISLAGDLASSFKERVGKAATEQERAVGGEISPIRATLRTIGQGAGFVGDVIGKGVMALGKTLLPKKAEEGIQSMASKIFSTQPVQQAVEAYGSFKEKHPEAAADLEALANIGTIAPIGVGAKTASTLAGKGLVKTGVALEKSGIQAAERATDDFLKELIKPIQTTAVKEAQVARTTETGIGPFKKSVIEPEPYELKAIEELKKVDGVKESNTFQQNFNVIQSENAIEAGNLIAKVRQSNFVVPKREVVSRLDNVAESLADSPVIVGDAQKTAEKLLAGAKRFVEENDGTGLGLLQARKDFDTWVLEQKPKAFDAKADNAFTIANTAIRRELNKILDEGAPNAEVKESLSRQSALYDAMDNIRPKAAKEADTAIARAFQRFGEAIGIRNETVRNIAAATGIFGIGALSLLNPIAAYASATTLLGFLTYKGGKLVLKPAVRKGFGELLQKAGKALGAEERTIIQEILDNYSDTPN